VVRALDLRLEIVGSIPTAALSSATLDKLFTHLSSASEVTTLWRYMNQFKLNFKLSHSIELHCWLGYVACK